MCIISHCFIYVNYDNDVKILEPLVRREVGADSISHYCLSNAPLDTSWQELARVQAQRFFIEHSFCEAKSECGMASYQVRRWDAWHNHMA